MSLKKRTSPNKVLDESQILISTKQYDIELIYHANLSQMKIVSLGSAFRRCHALTVLDLSQNKLPSLNGIQAVASTLVLLNASENCIQNLTHLCGFGRLERLWLEGNQLSDRSSIAPLAELKTLKELWLQRNAQMGLSSDDTSCVMIDNPICLDSKAYSLVCRELLSHVHSLDGIIYRQDVGEATAALDKVTSIDECVASFKKACESIKTEALRETNEESHLLRLLKAGSI
ncbi:unnamed protein product [Phytomonas sp. Hart1]|nr:unnamed protein product [Phytomonas sp. Hart1]|eukprot:CCW69996.1 unnamed protein product [Phytomonas sp. isolate Hart1]